MHPFRKQIVLRWAISLGLLLLALAWVATDTGTTLLREADKPRVKQKKLPLPSQQEMQSLRSTVMALSSVQRNQQAAGKARPVRGLMVDKPKPRVQTDTKQDSSTTSRTVSLSMIMVGGGGRFAVLNGIAYEEGNLLPDGRRVLSIEPDGVVLEIEGQEERLVWTPPHEVALVRADEKSTAQDEQTPHGATDEGLEASTQQTRDAAKIIGESINQ